MELHTPSINKKGVLFFHKDIIKSDYIYELFRYRRMNETDVKERNSFLESVRAL